jgi:hypothetical protein
VLSNQSKIQSQAGRSSNNNSPELLNDHVNHGSPAIALGIDSVSQCYAFAMEWRDYGTSREIRRLLKIAEREFVRPQVVLDDKERRQLAYPDLKPGDALFLALARTKEQQMYLIHVLEQAIDLKRAQECGIDIPVAQSRSRHAHLPRRAAREPHCQTR